MARILVTGGHGFIGSAVVARLRSAGHDTVIVTRSQPRAGSSDVRVDIAAATRATDWLPRLTGIEAVVNCAGVLQDSPIESTQGVHVDGIDALYAACERAGVRRVIHFSAIGVDRGALSAFSRTKLAGDEKLMARDLDWVILRPAVVVGRAAFGGSALFRGLATLPVLPVVRDAGPLQIVQLDDVVATVEFFLRPDAPARVALELAGPERLTFSDVVARYRAWLRLRPARVVTLPAFAARMLYRLGDVAGAFGWRTPLRTTARREIVRGAVGDPSAWTGLTGIGPRSLADALGREPASVQERWFAYLYALKPVVFVVFALFWIGTGLISVGPGFELGISYMNAAESGSLAAPGVIAGGLADVAIGLGILWRKTARLALYGALALSLFYAIAGTILLPALWIDPIGPMLKIWPIVALNLVALAILDER